MKPPNWDRLQEIYHSALTKPRSERDAFVAEACAGDALLQRQVDSLLKADDSDGFLNIPVTTVSSATDHLVGKTIDGRYEIEKELNQGGMSEVYLARDQNLNGRAVVIKVVSQELVHHSHVRKKFDHEVEALLRLKHPGVVRVLDKGELRDGRPYIVMEFVDGETLRSQIPAEGMNLERAASILRQIGEALDHVHANGIFHRDLKPENIMLKRGTDSVVLIDFGIAKVTDPVMAPTTTQGLPIGTLLYMSPEHLCGEAVMAASDVYSMAVLAYEMLTGRRPFKATSVPRLLDLQKAGVREKLKQLGEELSPQAQTLIRRALSFEPQARYKNAKEFGDELARALLTRVKTPLPGVSRGWLYKNRFVVTAALLVAALFAVYLYIRPLPVVPHSFTYFLTVQEMQHGKEYQEPLKSNGEETFESGDKFQLTVLSPEPAYVYIINEGPAEANDTNVTMIYPNRTTNNGSATLGANQSIQSDWITFRGPAGDDNFWIVWSLSPVDQLEAAKNEAFNHPRGGLTERTWVAVKQFLKLKQSEVNVMSRHYKETQKAIANGKGDLLVTLAQFKHR